MTYWIKLCWCSNIIDFKGLDVWLHTICNIPEGEYGYKGKGNYWLSSNELSPSLGSDTQEVMFH